jgi:hypothetical protein
VIAARHGADLDRLGRADRLPGLRQEAARAAPQSDLRQIILSAGSAIRTGARLVCAGRMAPAIAQTTAMHNCPVIIIHSEIPDMSPTKLFEPYKLGPITLPNRLVMAPLTRNRAVPPGMVPSPLAVDYYGQRASAGLLITEASQVSQQGQGYQDTPGIYSKEQVAGWRKVTDRVHE